MFVHPEKLREEFRRDTYWGRIHFMSDDKSQKSTVLICASHEFLWVLFKARTFSEVKLNEWYNGVIEKWRKLGDGVFKKTVHYDVYATTAEGEVNGLEFLKNEVKP